MIMYLATLLNPFISRNSCFEWIPQDFLYISRNSFPSFPICMPFISFFGGALQFLDQLGMNPYPVEWKHRVLTWMSLNHWTAKGSPVSCLSFSCLLALASTSSVMLNGSGQWAFLRCSWSKWGGFQSLSMSMKLAVGFCLDVLYQVEEILFLVWVFLSWRVVRVCWMVFL